MAAIKSEDTISLLDQEEFCEPDPDLAAIRRLLEADDSEICPCCGMPFDKGKKRKLIDSCGHERCYSCIFTSEICPLCPPQQGMPGKGSVMTSSLTSCQDTRPHRTQVKTNGHFTTYMQSRSESREMSPCRLPRPGKPSDTNVMTQSCPTPPQGRKKFFLSSKNLKNPLGMLNSSSRLPSDNTLSGLPMLTQSANSDSSNRRWSSVIIGKIKSLWTSSSTSSGLNQLVSDDEGGCVKPMVKKSGKKNSQQDLYTRLGLLLGDGARHPTNRRPLSHDSVSSLASLEAHTLASTNTSPVSTLTGSSEADGGLLHSRVKDTGSDSVGSLMSVSGHSNASSSPLQRRHSLTSSHPGRIDEINQFRNRRQSIRRSARSASIKGPIDPKVRFAEFRSQGLPLKPLFFEVPQTEVHPIFVGREGVIREIEDWTGRAGEAGVLITGHPGTGKTALLLQLVDHSCFGRHSSLLKQELATYNGKDRPMSPSQAIYSHSQVNLVSERVQRLASRVVAYHFCQADNSPTCHVPDFIHSVAAQLCQAPQLRAYKEYLHNEPHILSLLSLKECIADSEGAWVRGVLEPLCLVGRGSSSGGNSTAPLLLLVDGLCEAEYHRPDSGHTLASFLAAHIHHTPPWLKFVLTVRTHMDELLPPMPFHYVSLDVSSSHSESLQKDLLDYINYRVTNSQSIQSNIISGAAGQFRLCQAVAGLARGSMLFAKLTLDLIEKGHLVAKSASYKVLPVSLSQIYLLHFNLRFPTMKSFEKVSPIISVCLSALMPLTLLEIYYSINSLNTYDFVSWEDFLQRFKMLNGFLIKRLDNTYMFFHPSFREWLIRRDEGENNKFLCDLRTGSLGIAMRLSRLENPLTPEKTLELGHHILKAHLYKNMSLHRTPSRDLQAVWIASVSHDVSKALASTRNVYSPNVKVSRLLLLSGADPDVKTSLLGSAPLLCLAAYLGLTDMVSLLLEFGANPSLANSQGSTPLSLAASKGHSQAVNLLVSAGAPLGRTDTSGRCALVHAARSGHFEVVTHLVSCDWTPENNDIDSADAVQQALVAASAQSHLQIVEYLLDLSEVRKDEIDPLTGEAALTMAAATGSTSTLAALINRGASLTTTNQKGESALQLAVREGHWGCVERLVQSSAPLEQADPQGRAPLAIAASHGHVALIELLLDKGADIERQDNDGVTALGWACLKGRTLAAHCLLDRGASVNQTTHSGRTPLDLAAEQPDPAIVQLLLERGGMLEHVDIQGMRPLDRAISYRNLPIVQSLLKRGAKLGPTTWALAQGKTDILLVLLNKLLEDGNVLYRKSRLEEAAHRYRYALAKFPQQDSSCMDQAFKQLKLNFLLNYSRCKRKMNEPAEAVELATQVMKQKPDCYEAYYTRAKARVDLREFDSALKDVQEALILLQPQNKEVRRVLLNLRDEIRAGQRHKSASIDTLNNSSSLTTDL